MSTSILFIPFLMKEINSVELTAPVKLGQVVIKNVLDTGADIIATNDD